MAGAKPTRIGTSALKAKFMRVAQTNEFSIKFNTTPGGVKSMLEERGGFSLLDKEVLELMCAEASLPGTSLATVDVTADYRGVSEKMAYRRIYDEVLSLVFYVDRDYKTIEFFDTWIDFITGMGTTPERARSKFKLAPYNGYQLNYPEDYKVDMSIAKYEKDATGTYLEYTFVDAFPVAVQQTPVAYGAADVLRYSVDMSYTRYVRERRVNGTISRSGSNPTGAVAGPRNVNAADPSVPPKTAQLVPQDASQSEFEQALANDRGGGTLTGNGTFSELNQINSNIA